jgi:hypothetical protein
MRMMVSIITQIRVTVVEKFERMVAQWIEHQHQHAVPLSTMIIQGKAKVCLRTSMLLSQIQKCTPLLPVLGGLNI